MSTSERILLDCIEIRRQFLRSVNLEKDYQSNNQNGDYIVTATARQVLHRVVQGLTESSPYRAWTITGPYGVGKSAFAVFLTKLLCHKVSGSDNARLHLQEADQLLASNISLKTGDGNGLLPIVMTARRAPVALCLCEAIKSSASSYLKPNQRKTILAKCESLLQDIGKNIATDSRQIVSLITEMAMVARNSEYSGLLLMIDEFGKLFEFAARVPQKADVFVLQEIAEQASRSGEFPTLFFGFLHQSFEEYGQYLDSITRKEWAKIHGRFEDVAFLEPAEQVIRMVSAAIKWKESALSQNLSDKIRRVANICAEHGVCPPGMKNDEFENICLRTYPLHPTALVALPFIFRRFAQNERSLFSYLSSMEPHGFQEYLRTHNLSCKQLEFLRLNDLFDYFTINFGGGLFRHPQARRWMEAIDVLDRKESLTPLHTQLVKSIGVLGALGEFSHLLATEEMIGMALGDTTPITLDIKDGLQFLQKRSIITHRSYNQTYRIWEGSDVDIDERIAEGERQLRGSIKLASIIQKYLEARPVVARRHSFQSGSLRYFSTVYLDDPAQVEQNLLPAKGAAGQIIVSLSSSPAIMQAFVEVAALRLDQPEVVFAIPQQFSEIHAAVTELAALRWAWENTPELRDDRVARREIARRISEAEHFLRRRLVLLLDPREDPAGSGCLWYWKGKSQPVHSWADVSRLLSDICDSTYGQTPWIRNELIVRRVLSSAAAAARRTLVEKMLTNSDTPNLGIEGYPPERSIYESVLKDTGIHREISSTKWEFCNPDDSKQHGVVPVWDILHKLIFETNGEPCQLDTLFQKLANPPYGVMDGLHPVLLCAFMMAHPDETTLYREGTFIPEPSIADFEVLMRRPELFAVGGSRITGMRAAVVQRLAKGLGARPATVSVVRFLFRMVRGLPEFAWRTKRLAENTLKMREAFEKAKSPEKFLYVELPIALGVQPFSESRASDADIETFFGLLNAALKDWSGVTSSVIAEAKRLLLQACGLEADDSGWQHLREISTKLEPGENDPVLLQFFRRVMQVSCDEAGISSVLALVANRPPVNWHDNDVNRFPDLAKALGESIKRAMSRFGLTGESRDAMAILSPEQRDQAQTFARDWGKKLRIPQQRATPEVLRAALLLLVDQVKKATGEENASQENQ